MSRPMVDHVAQRERRLDEMIKRLGVDLSRFRRDAHGATYERASWNCVRCRHPDACTDWIERFGLLVEPPEHLCPNCDILRSYAART